MNEKQIIAGKPRKDDKMQIAITEKINNAACKEMWAREAFEDIRTIQIEYMRNILSQSNNLDFVHDCTQEILREIAELFKSHIVEGSQYLDNLQKGTTVLITTNHFGAYKLLGANIREDLNVEMEGYDYMYPYPGYFAALYPIAEALGAGLYYTSKEFPGIFGDIHKSIGSISVPIKRPKEGRMSNLIKQTETLIEDKSNKVALVNFPEGTTSGKPSGRGPYDLEEFRTGGYVVAANTDMTVVPVAQYFDPKTGFILKVFEPYTLPKNTEQDEFKNYALHDQEKIQKWLNAKQQDV